MVSSDTEGESQEVPSSDPRFIGGPWGALVPFLFFVGGVIWLVVQGAPDERGFWPIALAALSLGLLMARDRDAYSRAAIEGIAQPIVAMMILAWLLAGVLGALVTATGLVQSLAAVCGQAGLQGGLFAAAAFVVCCMMSTATGTSIGTVLLCGPLLYPTGGTLGADPAVLMGAILGGATFGDNISPISDTTIASSLTQEADLGGVVRSRLRYALPAGAVSIVLYAVLGGGGTAVAGDADQTADPKALLMLVAPLLVIGLLLRKRHLVQGLIFGILAAIGLALPLGLLTPSQLLNIDAEALRAGGLIMDGLERGVGASVLTLFLMALVANLERSGLIQVLLALAEKRIRTARGADTWIFLMMNAVVLMITHTTVAILAVGRFTRETGRRYGVSAYRRANLLDVSGCGFPFILPYMLPVVLAAGTTSAGEPLGLPRLSPAEVGFANFHSMALLVVLVLAIVTGWGRGPSQSEEEKRSS